MELLGGREIYAMFGTKLLYEISQSVRDWRMGHHAVTFFKEKANKI